MLVLFSFLLLGSFVIANSFRDTAGTPEFSKTELNSLTAIGFEKTYKVFEIDDKTRQIKINRIIDVTWSEENVVRQETIVCHLQEKEIWKDAEKRCLLQLEKRIKELNKPQLLDEVDYSR